MKDKAVFQLRRYLLAALACPAVFVFAAFGTEYAVGNGPMRALFAVLRRLDVVLPWGIALCLLYLERSVRQRRGFRWDLAILLILLAWVIAPFALRFGMTNDNMYSWYASAIIFFGVYALTGDHDGAQREAVMDVSSTLFALYGLELGVAALWCAITVQDMSGFGVINGEHLCLGMHHNSSGILALCCALMSAIGFFRRKHIAARLFHLLPSVMMAVVVVLTQSRTSRYCLLASLALGGYGVVVQRLGAKKAIVRHAAGLMAAALVFVGGYAAASALTDAALTHYAYHQTADGQIHVPFVASARAQEMQEDEQAASDETQIVVKEARGAGDFGFTGRNLIWGNVFKLWKENPKHAVIGFGVGRTSRILAKGTLVEADRVTTTHNAYLQYAVDYGFVGFALLAAFLCLSVKPCLRVFFAKAGACAPGYRALCCVIVSALLTGLMESVTFTMLSPMNVLLFFALALVVAQGREMQSIA